MTTYPYQPRPFAAQARALCPESSHNGRTECPTCKALETRLTPVTDVLRGVLADADLTITYRRDDECGWDE